MESPGGNLPGNEGRVADTNTKCECQSDEDNSYRYGCYDARSVAVDFCSGTNRPIKEAMR